MRPRHPHPGTAVAKVARAPRTPTDEDKVRFRFPLPLPPLVKGRSIRSRAPIPSRARKEAPAPGRGVAIGDSRGKSTIGPAPGAVSPATPRPGRRAKKGRVCFIAPSVSAGCGSARPPRTRRCSLVARGDLRAMNGKRDGDFQNRNCHRPHPLGCSASLLVTPLNHSRIDSRAAPGLARTSAQVKFMVQKETVP